MPIKPGALLAALPLVLLVMLCAGWPGPMAATMGVSGPVVQEAVEVAETQKQRQKRRKRRLTRAQRKLARHELRETLVEYDSLAQLVCDMPEFGITFPTEYGETWNERYEAVVAHPEGQVLSDDGEWLLTWKDAVGGQVNPCEIVPSEVVEVELRVTWEGKWPRYATVTHDGLEPREVRLERNRAVIRTQAGRALNFSVEYGHSRSTVYKQAISRDGWFASRWITLPPDKGRQRLYWRGIQTHRLKAAEVSALAAVRQVDRGPGHVDVDLSRLTAASLTPTAIRYLTAFVELRASEPPRFDGWGGHLIEY